MVDGSTIRAIYSPSPSTAPSSGDAVPPAPSAPNAVLSVHPGAPRATRLALDPPMDGTGGSHLVPGDAGRAGQPTVPSAQSGQPDGAAASGLLWGGAIATSGDLESSSDMIRLPSSPGYALEGASCEGGQGGGLSVEANLEKNWPVGALSGPDLCQFAAAADFASCRVGPREKGGMVEGNVGCDPSVAPGALPPSSSNASTALEANQLSAHLSQAAPTANLRVTDGRTSVWGRMEAPGSIRGWSKGF